MGYNSPEGMVRTGIDILKTTISEKTKAILVQLGNVVDGIVSADNAELWQQVGFVSRPSIAEGGKEAAQAIVLQDGGYDRCIATRDLRGLALAGQMSDGETCVYAPGSDGNGQARMLLKKNGSVNIYTREGNTDSGTGMGIFVNPEDGSISLLSPQGFGIIINADGITLTAKDSALSLRADGSISLVGKAQTQIDGSTIVLGSAALPGVNAVCVGTTGVAAVASTKVFAQLA